MARSIIPMAASASAGSAHQRAGLLPVPSRLGGWRRRRPGPPRRLRYGRSRGWQLHPSATSGTGTRTTSMCERPAANARATRPMPSPHPAVMAGDDRGPEVCVEDRHRVADHLAHRWGPGAPSDRSGVSISPIESRKSASSGNARLDSLNRSTTQASTPSPPAAGPKSYRARTDPSRALLHSRRGRSSPGHPAKVAGTDVLAGGDDG